MTTLVAAAATATVAVPTDAAEFADAFTGEFVAPNDGTNGNIQCDASGNVYPVIGAIGQLYTFLSGPIKNVDATTMTIATKDVVKAKFTEAATNVLKATMNYVFTNLSSGGGKTKGKRPTHGSKGKGHRKVGGADPSMATGSPIYNTGDLKIGAAGPALTSAPVPMPPAPFSAGAPIYGSVEKNLPYPMTAALSGGVSSQSGGGTNNSKSSKLKYPRSSTTIDNRNRPSQS